MPGHAARVAGQTAPSSVRGRLGEGGNTQRGWAEARLYAAFRVLHYQRVAFACHGR